MQLFSQIIFYFLIAGILARCGKGAESVMNIGICDGYKKPEDSSFVLPFAAGISYEFGQGNCSPVSHYGGGRFAYDIGMDIGTTITAIRAGTVIKVVESFSDGNGCPNANVVQIKHDDGTVAVYAHLTKDGALVEEKDVVTQGQAIGLSGNTGCSTGPHLHLQVDSKENSGDTIPISFMNVAPSHRQLQEGETYEALAY